MDANRKLISEFDIEHQTKKKKVISVHLFFFNDCIIVASPDKSIRNPKVKWKLKERIPLEEAEIQDKINTESLKNIFEIIVEKKALIFSMPSSKAKEDFIKDFYWNKTQFKKELELKNSSSPKEDTPKKQKEGAKKEEEKKTKDDSKKFGTVKDEKKTKEEEKKTKDEEKKAKSSGLRESLFIRRESAPPSPDTNPEKGKEKESSKEKNKKK